MKISSLIGTKKQTQKNPISKVLAGLDNDLSNCYIELSEFYAEIC
jgi:hypothetical protein